MLQSCQPSRALAQSVGLDHSEANLDLGAATLTLACPSPHRSLTSNLKARWWDTTGQAAARRHLNGADSTKTKLPDLLSKN